MAAELEEILGEGHLDLAHDKAVDNVALKMHHWREGC